MDGNFESLKTTSKSSEQDVWSGVSQGIYSGNEKNPKPQAVACIGHFSSAPGDEAFALHPPQIALNGGLAVFNQNCDDDRIKNLPNFKPASF